MVIGIIARLANVLWFAVVIRALIKEYQNPYHRISDANWLTLLLVLAALVFPILNLLAMGDTGPRKRFDLWWKDSLFVLWIKARKKKLRKQLEEKLEE